MGATEAPKLGFEADIKPLFRDKDRDAMRRAFDLWSYGDVVAHAAQGAVLVFPQGASFANLVARSGG